MALESEADELYYGGQAGGGKSALTLLLAFTKHQRSVIFRREYKELRGLLEDSRILAGPHGRFNGTDLIWRLPDRTVEFGAVQYASDVEKWRGRAHDLKAFDELPDFLLTQYLFLRGWARSPDPRQRVRTVATGNPPNNPEGMWVIERWAPWLDKNHLDPAAPGDLRWYAMLDHGDGRGARDTECGSGKPFDWNGEMIYPQSRTFIPAKLDDNPFLTATSSYRATLQSMPEPLRSQLLFGDHTIGLQDHEWQVIPTEWVQAAMDRWRKNGRPVGLDRKPVPLSRMGIDIAQGGHDKTVFAKRYQNWWDELEHFPGTSSPDAEVNTTRIVKALAGEGPNALGTIDANGIGAATYFLLKAKLGGRIIPFLGHMPATSTDMSGTMTFFNLRAQAYWTFREWLDPKNGFNCALPPSRELLADLTAVRLKRRSTTGLQLESKEEIKARIGRSPDDGDAIVNSLIEFTGVYPDSVEFSR